jgi:exonuclease SbcD
LSKIRFVQCGDIHIGMPFSSFKGIFGLPEKRRRHIEETFAKSLGSAADTKSDFLIICGDLFEEKYATRSVIENMNYEFGKVSRVVMIPGNHDPFKKGYFFNRFTWREKVFVLSPERPFIEFPDMSVAFYHYNSLRESDSLGQLNLQKDRINILMFHGTIDTICTEDRYLPVTSEELERYGFDYIAAGHFHNTFLQYGKNKTIHNAGSPEPLGFDEEGIHSIITGEITKEMGHVECRAEKVQVSNRFYKTLEITTDPEMSLNEIISFVRQTLQSVEGHKDMLARILLKGRRDPKMYLDTLKIQESLVGLTLYAKVTDETLPDFDISQISKEQGIRGVFVRNVLEKMEQEPHLSSFYRSVMIYGLEALSGNRPSLTDPTKEGGR